MTLGTCKLKDVAKVSLGFKSLQNQFFYVSKEIIAEYRIEKAFLRPIFQLKDLGSTKFRQDSKAIQWVFYCKKKEQDLRGSGALRYIRAMENRPATEKKQTGKHLTIREALEAQGGGIWYMPKAQLHKANLWIRKAFNSTFNPFIFQTAAAMDQRCNYVVPRGELEWKLLGAVLTSSLFALAAESFGSASMGAGALEIPTTKAHELPVADIRNLKDPAEKHDLVSLVDAVWTQTQAVDWSISIRPPEQVRALDEWLLARMRKNLGLDRLYSDVAATVRARLAVAKDKAIRAKLGIKIDINAVAESVAATVRPLLESRNFPEAFAGQGGVTQRVDFSRAKRLDVECCPMMDRAVVVIKDGADQVLLEGQYPRSVAQVIVKAVLLGRRDFTFPSDVEGAVSALKDFSVWFPTVVNGIQMGCGLSAVGTRYEADVYQAVLKILHLSSKLSEEEFYGHVQLVD